MLGNKQEELETVKHLENYDLAAVMKTQWDDFCNWNAMIEGYQLFRRYSLGRRAGGVALNVKGRVDCEELILRNSEEQAESFWVRIRDKTNKGHW